MIVLPKMSYELGTVDAPLKGHSIREVMLKRIFLSLAGFVTLFTLMAAPVQSAVLATPKIQTAGQPEAETFMGTILKDGENYMLSDPATKSRYMLDDAKKARPLRGEDCKSHWHPR